MRAFDLVEKPHVLDCNDRLICKGHHQFDLLFGERPYRLALQAENADGHSFPEHRNSKKGTEAPDLLAFGIGVFLVGQNVRNVRDGALDEGSAGPRSPIDRGRMGRHELLVFGRESERRFEVIVAIFRSSQDGHIGFAQPGRGLDQRIENGLQIESRAADDLEHVCGGGLLLQRFT